MNCPFWKQQAAAHVIGQRRVADHPAGGALCAIARLAARKTDILDTAIRGYCRLRQRGIHASPQFFALAAESARQVQKLAPDQPKDLRAAPRCA